MGNLRNLNFLSFENRAATALAPLLFSAFVAGQLFVLLAGVRYLFRPTWDHQLAAGPLSIVFTCLAGSLMMSFGEYFFHRYILHIPSLRLLSHMCSSHRAHHKLTSIRFDASTGTVRSAYPITNAAHGDKSTFPPWALAVLFAVGTPVIAAVAYLRPGLPIVIGGYAAIAIAHWLYEMIHTVHHEPYESFWQPRLACSTLGPAWKWLYGFHQAHHANYLCNLNVAGFFGVPVADLVFGTYKQPDPLLLDGASATSAAARRLSPSARWPIRALDRMIFNHRPRPTTSATNSSDTPSLVSRRSSSPS